MVTEALLHLRNKSAEKWTVKNGLPWPTENIERNLDDLQYSEKSRDNGMTVDICKDMEDDRVKVHEILDKFCSVGRQQSSTFTYWDSFIEAGELLLRLIKAERDVDFNLHFSAAAETIPYFILAGRNKYAKYTPIYVAEVKHLQQKQPEMYKHLENGGFVVRRSGKIKFNSVLTDQSLEQTINQEAKGRGGVVGFTLRKSALLRWLLTRHVVAEYSVAFKSMTSSEAEIEHHPEFGSSRNARDHSDVLKILVGCIKHFENPFDLDNVPASLVNITTGKVAPKEIENSVTQITGSEKNPRKSFDRMLGGR